MAWIEIGAARWSDAVEAMRPSSRRRRIAVVFAALAAIAAPQTGGAADLGPHRGLDEPEAIVDPATTADAFAVARIGGDGLEPLTEIAAHAAISMGCDGCVRAARVAPEPAIVSGERRLRIPAGYAYCAAMPSAGPDARPGLAMRGSEPDLLLLRGEGSAEILVFFVKDHLLSAARDLSYCAGPVRPVVQPDTLQIILQPVDAVRPSVGFEARADF